MNGVLVRQDGFTPTGWGAMRILGINRTELIAGLITIAVGAFAIVEARKYHFGTAIDMGPGYFPVLLGGALIIFGVGIMLLEGRIAESAPPPMPAFRPLAAIVAAVLVFALLVESMGLVPAVVAAVFVSSLAERRPSLPRVALTALVMAVLTVGIFDYGLGLQMQAFK